MPWPGPAEEGNNYMGTIELNVNIHRVYVFFFCFNTYVVSDGSVHLHTSPHVCTWP